MFSLFHQIGSLDVTGLIHHPVKMLGRSLTRRESVKRPSDPVKTIEMLSNFVVSTTPPINGWSARVDKAAAALNFSWLQMLTILGARVPLDEFNGTEFGDFLWQTLFRMSLPPSDFERCRTARYVTLWSAWEAMHACAMFPWSKRYTRVDTSGYDVFVAQTPWPGRVNEKTRLVIRYHDAVPVFLPHTTIYPRSQNFFHLSALRQNAKSAAFACVSEHSRTNLLRLFPHLENRTFVVSDCIGEAYFPVCATRETVAGIIASRVDATTEPVRNGYPLYASRRKLGDRRFLLMVSTLEPRKNHLGLLAAWEALRLKLKDPIALVFVGSLGWGNSKLLQAMRRWQLSGDLFHLSELPPPEMRSLYSAAEAVICPSVSEGFDLPGIEAMRCGAAVVASDIPAHREIFGDAVLYFDPYSTDSTCDALMRVLMNGDMPSELRRRAEPQAARFGASTTLRQWDQVFEYCRTKQAADG
jgi:glycosyltransferase involved in cell wall biosynthesis